MSFRGVQERTNARWVSANRGPSSLQLKDRDVYCRIVPTLNVG